MARALEFDAAPIKSIGRRRVKLAPKCPYSAKANARLANLCFCPGSIYERWPHGERTASDEDS